MIHIKFAQPANAPEIAKIEQYLQGSHAWSKKQVLEAFTEKSVILIAFDDARANSVVGYALAQYVLDEAELHIIGVHKNYQRQGIAKQLFNALVTQLKGKDISQLFLEVRASNFAAISLYHLFGFEQVGIRKGYYSIDVISENNTQRSFKSYEDALVMSCSL